MPKSEQIELPAILAAHQRMRFAQLRAPPESAEPYILVITAHDDEQAKRYAKSLAALLSRGALGAVSGAAVVADRASPGSAHRPGPGGATCNALECLAQWAATSVDGGAADAATGAAAASRRPALVMFSSQGTLCSHVDGGGGASRAWPTRRPQCLASGTIDHARVLMVHGGGYSSRLPNHSVSGKPFAPFPRRTSDQGADKPNGQTRHASPSSSLPSSCCSTLLEAKAASLVPLLTDPAMPPGVFVAASDDVILADGSLEASAAIVPRTGITALAHRSPVEVAISHGVFVLAPRGDGDDCQGGPDGGPLSPQPLRRVLSFPHKASASQLREAGAFCDDDDDDGGTTRTGGKSATAWTDSAFFVSAPTAARLLEVYLATDRFGHCEIDCYSDFLQCASGLPARTVHDELGSETEQPGARQTIRAALRRALALDNGAHGLHALAIKDSVFFHLGTMREYVDHLTGTRGSRLLACADGSRVVCARLDDDDDDKDKGGNDGNGGGGGGGDDDDEGDDCGKDGEKKTTTTTEAYVDPAAAVSLLDSHVDPGAYKYIEGPTVVEFCTVGPGWNIGAGSILSHVHLPPPAGRGPNNNNNNNNSVVIPANTFMHTVTSLLHNDSDNDLSGDGAGAEVTHIFATTDDLKGCKTLLGVPWRDALAALGLEDIVDEPGTGKRGVWPAGLDVADRCLFRARIFPLAGSGASAAASLQVAARIWDHDPTEKPSAAGSASSSSNSSSPISPTTSSSSANHTEPRRVSVADAILLVEHSL
jgi:hypothetical protein